MRRNRRKRDPRGELSTSESDNGARKWRTAFSRAIRSGAAYFDPLENTRALRIHHNIAGFDDTITDGDYDPRKRGHVRSGLEPDPPNKMSVWCDAWTPGVKFPVSRASTEPRASWGRAVLWKQGYGRAVPCSRIADTSISGDLMNVMRGPHDADFLCVESSDNTLDRAD